jgi:endonuclease/exonuclease/phosphatase family metal-dependent hydrolase
MATRVRLATLNLLYYPQGDRWRERRPLVESELRRLGPDVMGLQEVDRSTDQDRALAAAAGPALDYHVYRASDTVRARYPRAWDGVVLLVRRSAGAIRFHHVRRLTHLRVVQAIGIVRPDGRTLTVANTHLHHPDGPKGYVPRLRQAKAVLDFLNELPDADATVLGGDLNGQPDEPALLHLFDAGFRSAMREAGVGDVGTFGSGLIAPTVYRGPRFCIDYLLVRGAASVRQARLAFDQPSPDDPGLYPSDHLGLVADLELAGAPAARPAVKSQPLQ